MLRALGHVLVLHPVFFTPRRAEGMVGLAARRTTLLFSFHTFFRRSFSFFVGLFFCVVFLCCFRLSMLHFYLGWFLFSLEEYN